MKYKSKRCGLFPGTKKTVSTIEEPVKRVRLYIIEEPQGY